MRGGWEHGFLERMTSITSKWRSEEDYFAAQVWSRAALWLEENHQQEKPFLLWVDCFDPHEPFLVPKRYADLYDTPDYNGVDPIQPKYGPTDYLTPRELERMRHLYAADVSFVDHWFGMFVGKLKALGLLETTLICLTSDHGFQLGEHGVVGKVPAALWGDLHDVPFIVRHPEGIGAGKRFDAFVQSQDMFTTVLRFLDVPDPYPLDGKDLWPVIQGKGRKVRDYLTCGYTTHVRAVDDEYSYVSLKSGEQPQLCDLRNDPAETINLAKDKPAVVRRMWDYIREDAQQKPILPDWSNSPLFHARRTIQDHI